MATLIFAAGLVIGVLMGLLGGGGSIMAVPVFVYAGGMPAKLAIALALVVVGCTSAVGVIPHLRRGHVDVRRAAVFVSVSSGGSFLGARASVVLTGEMQLLIFAIVMSIAAFFMIRPSRTAREQPTATSSAEILRTIFPAFGVGLLTGIVGVGGGFMIVPVLTVVLGMGMQRSIGTSLLIIAVNSLFGSLGYLSQNELWDMAARTTVMSIPLTTFTAGFLACTFAGVVIGSRWSDRLPPAVLKRTFGFFLLCVSGSMILQRLGWW
jgi:uncharacterized membrane protein YfcA